MGSWVSVRNRTRGGAPILRARWCRSFGCRLRGLTFRRSLPAEGGLILVQPRESRADTAIHMWAVFFPIAAVWLDRALRVVDCRLARPWWIYVPQAPAQYVVEADPGFLQQVSVGDALEFVDETLG